MNRKLAGNVAASYVLAALLLSMVVTFVAFDLNAVHREAFVQNAGQCSDATVSACQGRAIPTMWGARGVVFGSTD